MLMSEASSDVRSTTGSNIRNIMLLVGGTSVQDVRAEDASKVSYFKLKEEEKWKVSVAKEIVNVKASNMEVPGFIDDELDEILKHICTE